jgi:hypothetical protein
MPLEHRQLELQVLLVQQEPLERLELQALLLLLVLEPLLEQLEPLLEQLLEQLLEPLLEQLLEQLGLAVRTRK